MKHCILAVFMFVFCGLSHRTSWAQAPTATPAAGPTLAETSKFILDKLSMKQFHYIDKPRYVTLTQTVAISSPLSTKITDFAGCLVTVTRKVGAENPLVYEFTPRRLDLRSIKVTTVFYGDDERPFAAVALPVDSHAHPGIDERERIVLVGDPDLASRLVNAFVGMAKLCGAKEEAY